MKFSISADVIKEGLFKVAKCFGDKTASKPIHLSATKDSIALVTSTGETEYRWTYSDSEHFSTEVCGSVTFVGDKLLGASEYLKDEVSFSFEANLLKVVSGKIALEVKTVVSDLKTIPPTQPEIKFLFDTSLEIPKIIHSMSDDTAKPKMLGILVDLKVEGENKVAIFKAVQPNRAAKIEMAYDSDSPVTRQITLPCFLARMMSTESLLGLAIDNNTLVACFRNYEVRTPLTETPFMNPDSAFTHLGDKTVKFQRLELARALRLIRSSDRQNALAKFTFGSGAADITSYNEYTGKSKVTVKSDASDKFNLSLNFKFMLDLLSSLEEDEIEFKTEGHIFVYKSRNLHYVTTVFGT